MPLPSEWVDRIFEKLTLVYGRDFLGRWEGLDIDAVKADWAHELGGFGAEPSAIRHALEHLPPGKPPTVLEFKAMAQRVPQPFSPPLPAPERTPEEKARISELLKGIRMRLAATGGSRPGNERHAPLVRAKGEQ
jgi:hypothetical protein